MIEVAPNGHANSARRPLLGKGVKYIPETCRALFAYAARRRHLSPYAENPSIAIEVDRIPVEQCKPILLFTPEQERRSLEGCDDWQDRPPAVRAVIVELGAQALDERVEVAGVEHAVGTCSRTVRRSIEQLAHTWVATHRGRRPPAS
jgi:hypothetical protein